MTKNQFTIQPGNALPLGVTKVADGVQFAIYLPDKRECYLKLFRKGHQTEQYRIPLTDEYRMGSVYFVHLRSKNTTSAFDIAEELSDKYEYVYEADGEDIVEKMQMKNSKKRSKSFIATEWKLFWTSILHPAPIST